MAREKSPSPYKQLVPWAVAAALLWAVAVVDWLWSRRQRRRKTAA